MSAPTTAPERGTPVEWVLWAVLALLLVGVTVVGIQQLLVRRALGPPLPLLGSLPEFALVERSGQAVGSADLRGRIWIADFIFTRCDGTCPLITKQMADLQRALAAAPATAPLALA